MGFNLKLTSILLQGSTDEPGVGQMFVYCSGGDIHRHPQGKEKVNL